MTFATPGRRSVHQHGVHGTIIEGVELVAGDRQRLDDTNVTLTQLCDQIVTQRSVNLYGVWPDEFDGVHYGFVIVVVKNQRTHDPALRRFGNGQRPVE